MKQRLIDLGFRVGKNSDKIHSSIFRSKLVLAIAEESNDEIANHIALLFQSADIVMPDDLLETESECYYKDICSFMLGLQNSLESSC